MFALFSIIDKLHIEKEAETNRLSQLLGQWGYAMAQTIDLHAMKISRSEVQT